MTINTAGTSPASPRRRGTFVPALFGIYVVTWLALAVSPRFRQDWLLENVLVFGAVPWLLHRWRTAPFSDFAWAALFVFFMLHAVGAHYTYSEVPYDAWWNAAFGKPLDGSATGAARNQFDRVVHLGYGLLIGPAAVEVIGRGAAPRGLWRWLLPWTFLCAHSVIYELIEWAAALVFGGDLGVAYLGTQGDVWDAQKDMALASFGAALGVSIGLGIGRLATPAARTT
jgi:putative membrane protein